MIAYPGRTFGQLYHRLVRANGFRTGSIAFGDRTIELSSITKPVLVFGGATDGIAPIASVKALVGLLENSEEVRFEIVPGGHLGMLTGRGARRTTWKVMDEWIEQWSTREKPARPPPPARRPRSRVRRNRTGARSARTPNAATTRSLRAVSRRPSGASDWPRA